jgi:hypothetical protein
MTEDALGDFEVDDESRGINEGADERGAHDRRVG